MQKIDYVGVLCAILLVVGMLASIPALIIVGLIIFMPLFIWWMWDQLQT